MVPLEGTWDWVAQDVAPKYSGMFMYVHVCPIFPYNNII